MPIFNGQQQSVIYDHNTGLVSTVDGVLGNTLPVYTWGSQPSPWDVPFGTEILIHPNCLTGYGANTHGIKLRSDLVNWRFADSGQMLYGISGSVASPLVANVAGAVSESSIMGALAKPMIPAFMLYKGCRGIFKAKVRKNGANSTYSLIARLGVSVSAVGNEALFNQINIANTDKKDYWIVVEFYITDAGPNGVASMTVTNVLTPNGTAVDAIRDRTSSISTIAPVYFDVNISAASASDTFSLIAYDLELKPL